MAGKRLLALLLSALLLSGCARREQEYPFAPRGEEQLVVYTSHKQEVYGPIIQQFQQDSGIWVEVVTGGTNELLERIAAGGAPACDVMFGGGVESLDAYRDCFTPYRCPTAPHIREGLSSPGDYWTPFSSLPVVLIYNTKLVRAGAVTGWNDLLSPRWRGKIAFADPAVSGSSYTALITMLESLPGEEEQVLAAFLDNLDGTVLADSGDTVECVANGTLPVGVTLEESALKRIAQGASIAIVYPEEGTSSVPDGSALVADAPHSENAKKFLEFTQSYPVQQLVVDQLSRRSVRGDVAVPEELTPEEELTLIPYDVEQAGARKADVVALWQRLREEGAP